MKWTTGTKFEGLQIDTLYLLIKDAQKRIDTNPRDRNYVATQTEFIRLARAAIKAKENK